MKKLVLIFALATVVGLGQFAVDPVATFAKSVTWSNTFSNTTWYRLPGIVSQGDRHTGQVFQSPHVEVTYEVTVTNTITGEVITPGACVPQGTNLSFDFSAHQSSHVYWFATGYSNDSPYGEWRANASAPPVACEEKDRITEWANAQFVPLVVAPPQNKTVSNTNGLTCGTAAANGSVTCTASDVGNFTPSFEIPATQGYFYWRQQYQAGGKCESQLDYSDGDWALSSVNNSAKTDSTAVSVVALSIPYPICVTTANTPPAAPTVSISALSCPEYSLSIQSTDADGDRIRYGIDWDNNGTINEWVPANGYVASGEARAVTHVFRDGKSHTFSVYAQDEKGNLSPATSQSVDVPECATPPTVVLSADKTLLTAQNEGTFLRWQASENADSCTGTGFSTGGQTSGSVYISPAHQTTYAVTCVNKAGSGSDTETVSVKPYVASCNVYPRTLGRNTDFSAVVALSKGPFYWEWSGSGDPILSAVDYSQTPEDRTSNLSWYYQTPGVKTSQVRVRDAFGMWSDWKQCPDITITVECSDGYDNLDAEDSLADANDPGCHSDGNAGNPNSYVPADNDETDGATGPSISQCFAMPQKLNPGGSTTWHAAARGGVTPYLEYAWTGDDGLTGNTVSVTKSYANPGLYKASVSVKDSAGVWSTPVSCQVPVLVANQCSDHIDNDSDGKTDYNWGSGDPDCDNDQDNDEGGGSLTNPIAVLEGRVIGSGNPWVQGTLIIKAGEQVEVRWNASPLDISGIDACSSTDFNTGNAKRGSSQSITEPVSGIDGIDLTCAGPKGSRSDTLLIQVGNVPVLSSDPTLDVAPLRVRRDSTVRVDVNTHGHKDCTLTGVGIGTIVVSGPYSNPSAGPIMGETDYTLSCPTFNGGAPIKKTVRIEPIFQEE